MDVLFCNLNTNSNQLWGWRRSNLTCGPMPSGFALHFPFSSLSIFITCYPLSTNFFLLILLDIKNEFLLICTLKISVTLNHSIHSTS